MTKIMLVLMLIGSAADLASTEYCLAAPGCVEQNPFMENRAVRIAANVGAPVAYYFLFRDKPAWMGRIFFVVHVGSKVYATSRNIYFGMKLRF